MVGSSNSNINNINKTNNSSIQTNLKENTLANYWYRQRVLDRVHELHSSDSDNNYNAYFRKLINNKNIELISSAIILFGTWGNVLHEAGLIGNNNNINSSNSSRSSSSSSSSSKPGTDSFSQEQVIEQIRTLYSSKFDLSASFIKQVYPELYLSAKDMHKFGSWWSALEEAEVDFKYFRSPAYRFWTRNLILYTIHEYERAYGNLQPRFIKQLNPSLYYASHRYFKTWSNAVVISGLNQQRNLIKVLVEPLRTYILMEHVKKVFDLMGIENKLIEIPSSEINSAICISDSPETSELFEVLDSLKLPYFNMLVQEPRGDALVTANYRSWGFNTDKVIYENLSKFPKIEIYYITGEPRQWLTDSVKFINVINFYNELGNLGRDDIVSAFSALARGGIPKPYQPLYTNFISGVKKKIKKIKSGKIGKHIKRM